MSKRYLVGIDGDDSTNFSAFSPDVPGVVATGSTREEYEREMAKAIGFHLEGLRDAGEPIPQPASTVTYVAIDPHAA